MEILNWEELSSDDCSFKNHIFMMIERSRLTEQTTLLNESLSFNTKTEDSIWGGFGGYGIDYDLLKSLPISADYEAQLSKKIFSQNLRLGLAVAF